MEPEENKLKVALCLSGQPRTFRTVARNIREVFCSDSTVSVDIFIHSWLDNESYTVPKEYSRFEGENDLRQDLVNCFFPKRIKLEDKEYYKYGGRQWDQWMCQAHSVAESINLIRPFWENYDWVFWTRLDCFRADFSKEYYSAVPVNYSNLRKILAGHFTELVDNGSAIQKFFNFEDRGKDLLNRVVFSPYRCEPEGWCGNIVHLQDWSLMGTPGPMLRILGEFEETLSLFRAIGTFSVNSMYDAEGMSMELTLPFALTSKRVGLITTDKILSPDLWIYRPWAEICKLDPYELKSWEILKDVWNNRCEEWHINTPLSEIQYILKKRYNWYIDHGNKSTNSSIGKGNENTNLI